MVRSGVRVSRSVIRFNEFRMVIGGIEYLNEDAELFPDGSVHDATLAGDTDIQGLPCAGGRNVVFYPGGRLRLFWLSRPAIIGTVPCAPGIVYLHENGAPLNATLAADRDFAGRVVSSGEHVTLNDEGELLEFSLHLESDQVVGGLACASAFRVWQYPDGRPSIVVLASPSIIGRRQFPRGAELFLDEDGEVLEWRQAELDSGQRYMPRVFGVHEAAFQ